MAPDGAKYIDLQSAKSVRTNAAGRTTYMSEEAKHLTRLPAGHPEGFYEVFANNYKLVIAGIRRVQAGQQPLGGYPNVYDGLRGIQFVYKAVESSKKGSVWIDM
jgi:hypothetical protein